MLSDFPTLSTPCAVCPKLRGPVPPSGPAPSKVLLVGEGPARVEDRRGYPFAGSTGQELDFTYLISAGLSRYKVATTNAMQCSLGAYRNPTPGEASQCASQHLPSIINHFSPEIIVLMGAVACSLADPKPDLETQHGFPFIGRIFDWVGCIVPMYHPAAGMYDSRMMIQILQDWPLLREVVSGLESHPLEGVHDSLPLDYSLVTTDPESLHKMETELRNRPRFSSIAIDTETDSQGFELDPINDPPFCLSYSLRPGHGRVVMADNLLALLILNTRLLNSHPYPQIILHNALFDVPVLARFSEPINIPWSRVHDTMESAYMTGGRLPQGLKALSYRLLGIKMGDYLDLVKPASWGRQVAYLLELGKMGKKDIEQPWLGARQWTIGRKAKQAAKACMADPDKDPQERFKGWYKDEPRDIWAAEERLGKFPYMSIRFAPLDKTVFYSAQDADITGRLRGVLEREIRK